ncbi:hypothetical protein L3H37_10740, partial [Corynebacterium sp. MC-20]|uniref:hypothetical protein n=1 Tax=Corynebacterium parakroppenstedtii TaxID=2828363 RepID=UPI001F2894FA
ASWSNFLGIFQIFPSTQTEQNLGHFNEVSQVLFRLMKPVFETTYGAQRTPMPKLPQHRLPHQTHDSGIHTLNPHACNLRTSKIEK